jgi:REP element-mobilizing transposase RayT
MLRERKYEYRRKLPHYQKADWPVFVTFRKLLPDAFSEQARDVVLDHCLHDHGRRYQLHAAVVMPEHVHVLLTPLRDARGWPYALPVILKLIKGTSARSVNKVLHTAGPIWQEESFDHVLRSEESLEQKVEYIRQNPVRRGLVRKPEEYRWLWVERVSCGSDTPVRQLSNPATKPTAADRSVRPTGKNGKGHQHFC